MLQYPLVHSGPPMDTTSMAYNNSGPLLKVEPSLFCMSSYFQNCQFRPTKSSYLAHKLQGYVLNVHKQL